MTTYAVILERFNEWDWTRTMREQDDWEAHAAFMDELTTEGFVTLGGPLAGGRHVLLIVEAADEAAVRRRLADDPWWGSRLRFERLEAWEVLLGGPPRP